MTDIVGRPRPPHPACLWCPRHERWECKAKTKRRQVCHGTPAEGHSLCRMHAGISGTKYRVERDMVTAFNALALTHGEPAHVNPSQAVMGVLQMRWYRLHMLAGMVADQMERDAEYDDTGALTRGHYDDDSGERIAAPILGETAGLIGFTSGPAGITGEEVRALVQLEAEEADRVAKVAKIAHDMGIADREIRLAEEQAGQIVTVINAVLTRLGLTPQQAALVPQAVSLTIAELIPGEVV